MSTQRKVVPSVDGPISKKDAQTLDQEFLRIRTQYGVLTPELIWQDAQDSRSRLHSFFLHDPAAIRKAYGIERARYLLRQVSIVIVKDKVIYPKTRGWIHIPKTREYRPVKEVLNDEELGEHILYQALSELRAFQRRYEHLAQLNQVFAAIRLVERKIKRKKQPKSMKAAA